MIVTPALRQFAISELKCAADATDGIIHKSVCDAVASGNLETSRLSELSETPASKLLTDIQNDFAKCAQEVIAEVQQIAADDRLTVAERRSKILGLKKTIEINIA